MRFLDLYWKSNPDWWEFVDHVQVIRKDAPPEAQQSYQNFLRQIEEMEEGNQENKEE